jgi:hypothetical protein
MKSAKTCVFLLCALSAVCAALPSTRIDFTAAHLEGMRWEYTYTVSNLGLCDNGPADIEQFTIWFDQGLYRNLLVTAASRLPDGWNAITWPPEPLIGDDGAFDAVAVDSSFGIAAGQSVTGFSVAFDWLGAGTPPAQSYDIIDPATFRILESGTTIPEPAALPLLTFGACLAHRWRRRNPL